MTSQTRQATQFPCERDRDLTYADGILTDLILDELWAWFGRNKDVLDEQHVFAKMVNAVRKPYGELLQARAFSSLGFEGLKSRKGSTSYTPSEDTTTNTESDDGYGRDETNIMLAREVQELRAKVTKMQLAEKDRIIEHLERVQQLEQEIKFTRARDEENCKQLQVMEERKGLAEAELKSTQENYGTEVSSLKTKVESLRGELRIARPHITIRSADVHNHYISANGTGVTSSTNRAYGSGKVAVAGRPLGWETYTLWRHSDGSVSFECTCFSNVFIRAHAGGLVSGSNTTGGGGQVNCNFGCGDTEKFWLRHDKQGKMGIEPVMFPGRWLRLDKDNLESINLQGMRGAPEQFYLMVVF